MNTIITIVIIVAVAWFILTYLVPLLGAVAFIVGILVVLATIAALMRVAGIWF